MSRSHLGAVMAAGLLCATPSLAGDKISGPSTHQGMCEASGAVMLPTAGAEGPAFLVVNDEDNVLRVFTAGQDGPGLPVAGADLNGFLRLDPKDEDDKADLEAATWLGDRIYVIGSHSRSGKGKVRKARHQFFAVTARPSSSARVEVSPTSKEAHSLLDALVALHPAFRTAVRRDVKEDPALAPEEAGLNIEGLTARPDGRSLLIGFRNPLSDKGEAWVVPFENPAGVVDSGAAPRLGAPIPLDLGGRGIRSMEYSQPEQVYYLVAGPAGSGGAFEIYRWSGKADDRPVAVKGSQAAIAAQPDFHPEALMIDLDGRRLHLLSDDGDRKMPGGKKCQKLDAAEKRAFRSFVLTLD